MTACTRLRIDEVPQGGLKHALWSSDSAPCGIREINVAARPRGAIVVRSMSLEGLEGKDFEGHFPPSDTRSGRYNVEWFPK